MRLVISARSNSSPVLERAAPSRHIVQGVLRAHALQAQNAVEGRPQLGEEGQRPAQVHHLALDLPALGQAGDGLVHHGGEDALRRCRFSGPPWFKSAWMSDLANTPHREAML